MRAAWWGADSLTASKSAANWLSGDRSRNLESATSRLQIGRSQANGSDVRATRADRADFRPPPVKARASRLQSFEVFASLTNVSSVTTFTRAAWIKCSLIAPDVK